MTCIYRAKPADKVVVEQCLIDTVFEVRKNFKFLYNISLGEGKLWLPRVNRLIDGGFYSVLVRYSKNKRIVYFERPKYSPMGGRKFSYQTVRVIRGHSALSRNICGMTCSLIPYGEKYEAKMYDFRCYRAFFFV